MRILLVEDEKLAASRLQKMIEAILPGAVVEGPLPSVKKALEWFENHPAPALAFFDIQLADGLSFEIFEQTTVSCPVIFTTAYDEYAIKAFRVNSVDYLLKPVREAELAQAVDKFKSMLPAKASPDPLLIEQLLLQINKQYKSRFVVKIGEHIHAVPVEEILYFFSEEKATFLVTKQNKRYIIDYALDHVEQMVDPSLFFRTNRKFLVGFRAIQQIVAYSGSRLRIHLIQAEGQEVLVSREKVAHFKEWLDQ
jgi:two-component system, LytTR family, response regulator